MSEYLTDNQAVAAVKEAETRIVLHESSSPEVAALAMHLPEQFRNEWTISKATEARFIAALKKLKKGTIEEVPMTCRGDACPMAASCPFVAVQAAPIGSPCPIESWQIETWTTELISDLQVVPESITQLNQIHDLVETWILDKRMTAEIGRHGLMIDVVVAVGQDGTPIYRSEPSPAYTVKMQQKRRKDTLLKQFMATRESQIKSGLMSRSDPSSYAADLIRRGEALKKQVQVQDAVTVEEADE